MSKKGGGGESSQTTVQKSDPWVGVQPNLLDLYANAGNWFHGGPTTVGTNPDMNAGWNAARGVAGGNPYGNLMTQAGNTAQNIASGQYAFGNPVQSGQMLTDNAWAMGDALKHGDNIFASGQMLDQSNPYLNKMVDAASNDVVRNFQNSIAPALASQFSMAGRTGSGAHVAAFDQEANTLAGKLGDITSNIRGNAFNMEQGLMANAYEAERSRQYNAFEAERGGQRQMWMQSPTLQLQAAQFAPVLQAAQQQYGFNNANALTAIGGQQRDILQQGVDDPLKKLQAYSTLLQGASGYGTSSTSQNGSAQQPYNKLTGTIGGGLGGFMLGNAIMPGIGGMVGAGIGALGGLFG